MASLGLNGGIEMALTCSRQRGNSILRRDSRSTMLNAY
ncbi:hypothetical protein AM1_0840 [Acaryochloris marina MBIC11017]|uniref:Uncharacterized protein n=1 Tax=Acaryochloris marina (strain MBIC 11017) TaxID=329726 RepID=B0BYJ8_ACAM1|nr:hypothetical protein AM1_0840 [Acaryochloris marina MBIC11017]